MEIEKNYYLSCNKAEVLLIESLAKEHRGDITLRKQELNGHLQIHLETRTQALRDYVHYMIQKLRSDQKNLNRIREMDSAVKLPTPPEKVIFLRSFNGLPYTG